jgi:isoleucyl-tRNA synthetase
MFDEIKSETFDEREQQILTYWKEQRIFERSIEERQNKPLFTFYDGPPFATGLPHYGHLLAGTIKDVVPRYKTMKGFCVPRRFGWDCHGLPIENEIEKAQELSGAASIAAFGIANFNEECRKIVLRYTEEWKTTVTRMGRWVDFDQTYRTMDLPFMESVWWVFKQLFDKGLVYEGFKVMPFSAKLGTPLSNFEAGENYKEVDDPSLTISLPLLDDPTTSLLIWTTTPWTLISNLAVMASPAITYVKIRDNKSSQCYILANNRLSQYYPDASQYTLLKTLSGKELAGMRYKPLFSYFSSHADQGAFRVILEESLSTEEGTGLVHSAPAFGEVDFYACQREEIPLVCPVDNNGCFTEEIPEYVGRFVKDADKEIIRRLKQMGNVFHHTTCHHRYPFCWRSDTPLIYKAVRTWFVAVEKIKDALLAANSEIAWMPPHIKEGRFGKWLEGARDWAISRNRYWGTPIPIWRAADGEIAVIGSIAELEAATGEKIEDLHRHFIDQLPFKKNGKIFYRIPEVFDCWFESGSMPYAQNHYPFENRELFEKNFPADFIAEGLDQTRGWFYTLTVLSAALFQKPAFKNVIVNGIILAEDGSKMSKRLRNYPDPMTVVHKYGADAIRLYMMHSPAVRADNLSFTESGVELVLRQVLIPFWNAYSFFVTYARIYKWEPTPFTSQPEAVIDRWILSLLNQLIQKVEEGMDSYDLSQAVEPFVQFIDQLTNWYIRRSRRRFWEEEQTSDSSQAFATLYHVLVELTKVAAPFVPFISETMYRNLRSTEMPESVHLCQYPLYHAEWRTASLETSMEAVQAAVSLGHSLRKEHKLKVRQPLASAYIASADMQTLQFLQEQQHLIAQELNVKEVRFSSSETELVALKAKPNFRVLGKKVGKQMKAAQMAIDQFDQHQLATLLAGNSLTLQLEGEPLTLTPEDVQVERSVHAGLIAANAGVITVALNTALTEELLLEGLAREIVNKINTMRRETGIAVTDRIAVQMETTARVQESFKIHGKFIQGEVLALSMTFGPCSGSDLDLNGEPTRIAIKVETP